MLDELSDYFEARHRPCRKHDRIPTHQGYDLDESILFWIQVDTKVWMMVFYCDIDPRLRHREFRQPLDTANIDEAKAWIDKNLTEWRAA